jgi:hypothetical protein
MIQIILLIGCIIALIGLISSIRTSFNLIDQNENHLKMKTTTTTAILPIKTLKINVPHINIGDHFITYGTRDFTKNIKRKFSDAHIEKNGRTGEYFLRTGFKVGKTTYYQVQEELNRLNDFLITTEDMNVYLYKFKTADPIGFYGDTFYQLIAEYKDFKYRFRFFIPNTNADGKKDVWYLNDWNNWDIPMEKGEKINLSTFKEIEKTETNLIAS